MKNFFARIYWLVPLFGMVWMLLVGYCYRQYCGTGGSAAAQGLLLAALVLSLLCMLVSYTLSCYKQSLGLGMRLVLTLFYVYAAAQIVHISMCAWDSPRINLFFEALERMQDEEYI